MSSTRRALREYLLHGEPKAVYHVYPRLIGARLQMAHRPVLKLLSEATLQGEVALHWEMRCPACGQIGHYADSLSQARHQVICAFCTATVVPRLDDDVLVTFSAHPALRPLEPSADSPDFRRQMAAQYEPTSGHEMLSVQTFRQWAQDQPLPSGESLEVRRVAIWFSDLRRSTGLYERRGDPYAFNLVREHFKYLTEAVDEAGGAVVKTIGDSVMAAFVSGSAAVRSALAGHRAVARLNDEYDLPDDDCLQIKFGIHAGPSIVVTVNGHLDYFGHTINLAARVAELVGNNDVALSQAVLDDPGTAELLASYLIDTAEVPIKGLRDPMIINHFTVSK